MGVLDTPVIPRRAPRARKPAPLASGPLDALLSGQFDALGYTAGAVPSIGATGSAWSRGYVLGAACASLQHRPAAPVTDRECFATALAAFASAYGSAAARDVLADTVAAAEAQEPDVEDGLLQGASDLALLVQGNAEPAALAFATRNAADIDEI